MDEIIVVIDKLEENINKMTEYFYQNNNQNALSLMPAILDDVMKVSITLDTKEGVVEEDKAGLVKILSEALKAMEEGDYVLLADILQYDMIDILEKFKNMFM